MKTIKIVKTSIYFVALLFIFSACSSDDNENIEEEVSIIGKWKFQSETHNGDTNDDFFYCEKQNTIEFTAQNEAFEEYFIHSSGTQQEGTDCILDWSSTLEYTLDGTSLVYIYGGNPHPAYTVIELTSTTLSIKQTPSYTINYTRL